MKKNHTMKSLIVLMSAILCAVSVSGCAKNPDSSIVKNKDMDNLINEAKNPDKGSADIDDMAEKYDTYQTSLYDDKLKCRVEADAKVTIPKTNQLSVFRVESCKISQEFADKFMDYLMKNDKLYDGNVLIATTRDAIEQQIRDKNANIEGYLSEYNASESSEDKKYWQSEIDNARSEIEKLQKVYEKAPSEPAYDKFPTDCKITGSLEMKNREADKDIIGENFYDWNYGLNENGEILYVVTGKESEQNKSLYIQNNENLGNILRYSSGKNGHLKTTGAVSLSIDDDQTLAKEDEGLNKFKSMIDGSTDVSFEEYENEKLTISEEQAKETAQKFVDAMGLSDYMSLYSCDRYNELVELEVYKETNTLNYRKEYIIRYLRNIDGAFISYSNKDKIDNIQNGASKKMWSQESLILRVNDDGIVGVDYNSPISIKETVVNKSNIKDFSEIKTSFENMVTILYASEIDIDRTIKVDRVELGYALISEQGSFDTGLLVPVWNFYGMWGYNYDFNMQGKSGSGDLVTVNAIDGSIINRENGY